MRRRRSEVVDVAAVAAPESGAPAQPRGLMRLPFFYGWVLTAVGFLANTLNGALLFHAFGTYVVLLREDFGWSRTSFALAFALMRVESGLLGPIEGWAIDKFGPRVIMRIGMVVFGLGLIMLSRVDSLFMFYASFLVMAFGSALGAFLPISVAVVNWFDRHRATALAVLSLGFSAGGLLQPAVVWALENYGWRDATFAFGILTFAVGLPLTQLVQHRPEDHGLLPDGATPEQHAQRAEDRGPRAEFTAREALSTSAFWFLALGHAASLLVFGAVSVHFVAHVHEGLGLTLQTAAAAITLMTVMMVIGQVVFGGIIGDRVNKRLVLVIAMAANTLALGVLAFANGLAMVLLFAVINGLATGTRGPLIQALRAEYFGREHFGAIMGFSSLVMTIGIIIGPVIAGLSYDILGAYRPGFLLLAVLGGLGAVFFAVTQAPPAPIRAEKAA